MAKYTGPVCRLCRAEHAKMFLKGERCHTAKCPLAKKRPAPGKAPRARAGKVSDYGLQLREKQKLKRTYGMFEKQFHNDFEAAERMAGKPGENLIVILESRLDNMVFRLHFAASRAQARQLVNHGHILVNGKRVTIASYKVKAGDVIQVQEKSKEMDVIKEALKEFEKNGIVDWLDLDVAAMKGTVKNLPARKDVTDLADIKEQLIVELYSK